MRTLTLLRHAKSSWAIPGLNDFDRPLKKKGYLNTFTMAERYCAKQIDLPDLVLTSPSQRTLATAQLFCEGIGFPRDKIKQIDAIYEGNTVDLYGVLSKVKNKHQHVLLVGHNPGLTYLAVELSQLHTTNVPTAGLVHMELAIESWGQMKAGCARLLHYDYPKSVRDNEKSA